MRLIDADVLKMEFPKDEDWDYPVNTNSYVCELIDAQPTIESKRKKGRWIKGGEQPYFRKHFDIVVCSKCNKRGEHRWNFCPNCGADMRERRTDERRS